VKTGWCDLASVGAFSSGAEVAQNFHVFFGVVAEALASLNPSEGLGGRFDPVVVNIGFGEHFLLRKISCLSCTTRVRFSSHFIFSARIIVSAPAEEVAVILLAAGSSALLEGFKACGFF